MNSRRDPRVMRILQSILGAGYRNFDELMLSLVRSDLVSVSGFLGFLRFSWLAIPRIDESYVGGD